VCVCVHVCVYVRVRVYYHKNVARVYVCACASACACACAYASVCVCVYVCVCVCVCSPVTETNKQCDYRKTKSLDEFRERLFHNSTYFIFFAMKLRVYRALVQMCRRFSEAVCLYNKKNCDTLQRTATHCNTLQHTATHCNTRNALFDTWTLW